MLEKCAWKACSSILLSLQLLDNCNNSCVSGRIAPQSPPSRASKCKMLYYFPGWLCHQGGSTSLGRGRMDIRQNPLCAGNGAMHRSCSSRSFPRAGRGGSRGCTSPFLAEACPGSRRWSRTFPSSRLSLLLQEQQGTCKGAKRRKSGSQMQRLGEMLRKMLLLPTGKSGLSYSTWE